ncbi:V-type ATP synthase subunit C [Clostridium sp. MSJ-11]|uniref:V-type ATP synthase subunit C n=1 Tax=Clostridium mobile TaxID=2841512 RepID=A0ABS6EI56_9CLOT|nr:V-type ATP synthase subunit C [Clostridium mobile]MBU5484890.1 V-type ATP synthase subunit C [Clostridium mobile]
MEGLQFTHAISRIRVLETKLLDKAKLDRMIDSSSAEDALKILGETEYSNYMSNIKRPEDYEELLSGELIRLYQLMYSLSPVKELIDIMSIKYDYHNLKVMIKGKILNKDLSNLLIPVGLINLNKLKQAFDNENFKELTDYMIQGIEKVNKSFEEDKDPQKIDIVLDSFMYKEMLYRANEIGDKFLSDYFKVIIDLTNIKTLLRVKKQNKGRRFMEEVLIEGGTILKKDLISYENESIDGIANKLSYTPYEKILRLGLENYGTNGNMSYFEKLTDNYIMDYIKKAKYVSFGIEPLLGYIMAKESEIKTVRIIMVGKLNNVAPEVIRERLRDVYV